MISAAKARDLIEVGECVFTYDEDGVIPCTVQKVDTDRLVTDDGQLYFEDHGELWWLTKVVAGEEFEKWKKNKS